MVSILLCDTKWSGAGVLLHGRVVLWWLWGAWIRVVGVLLVCGCAWGSNATGCRYDVCVGVLILVLLTAHEEEDAEADESEANDWTNYGTGDPCFA